MWIVDHRSPWLNPLLVAVTYAATTGFIWVALAPLIALRARRPPLPSLVVTVAAVWGTDLLAALVKRLVERPRPYLTVRHVHLLVARAASYSLPSTHAATSFAGATILSLLYPRLVAPLFALAAIVAFSRVYVGVHYPGDVVAGAAIGAAVALAVWLLAAALGEAFERRRSKPADG